MSEPTVAATVAHITVTRSADRIDAACAECGEGIDVGARFGAIDGEVLVLEWVRRHTHKPKGKR